MATQPQVTTVIESPAIPLPVPEELLGDQTTASQEAFLLRFGLRLKPAVGQPDGPRRQISEPTPLAVIEGQHAENSALSSKNEALQRKEPEFWSIRRIAFISSLVLITPAVAAFCGVGIVSCLVAEVSLVVSFVLVFTVLLLQEGKISSADFVELWREVLKEIGGPLKPKSGH
jgi:hypothetical protein